MELNEAILNRRSVRKFTDYNVSKDEIEKLIEAARWAPSWANTQTWEFLIITDKKIIHKITDTYSETNPAKTCSYSASTIILACAKTKIAGFKKGVQRTKFSDWFMFDLGMAVQNLCLKAHELKLGTVIVGSLDHNKCNEIISLPKDYETVVAIPIGKPDSSIIKKPNRKTLNEFTHLNNFNNNYS